MGVCPLCPSSRWPVMGEYWGKYAQWIFCSLGWTKKSGSYFVFELLFTLYYGPLFLVIALVNALLKFAPKVPKWFSAVFGLVLTIIAGTWILLPGLFAQILPAKPNILAHG